MKAYNLYLKIAILSAGVFGLLNWGQEGSGTLSPCAFALADSASVLAANTACDSIFREIVDSLGRAHDDGVVLGFEPSAIKIRLKEENEIREAIFAASQTQETITGVASFDSLSQKYGLICLLSLGIEGSSWYKRDFKLLFPLEVDFVAAYIAYDQLPYVEFAYLESWAWTGETPPYSALADSVIALLNAYMQDQRLDPSAILDHSWGHIKTYQKEGADQ